MKTTAHNISIPAILEVGPNKLQAIGAYVKKSGFKNLIILFGMDLLALFGETVIQSIQQESNIKILQYYEFNDNRLSRIIEAGFPIPAQAEAIVGIGGGKVLDAGKYIAFLNDLPFISVPTSTSNDGFSSSGCSLVINGKRTSVHAKMPYGIIVDTSVVKNSPDRFIYSGIGDIISKTTALYDWQLEEFQGKAVVDDFAAMIARKSVNSIVHMHFESIKDDDFLSELVDSLTMSGIAMEIAGSSAPASGSEHLISHALDKILDLPQLHGVQVGLATYIMSKVQNHMTDIVFEFLQRTGFFSYTATLGMRAQDFETAIDLAPSIKPNRHTSIHSLENRALAKRILREDAVLQGIFS